MRIPHRSVNLGRSCRSRRCCLQRYESIPFSIHQSISHKTQSLASVSYPLRPLSIPSASSLPWAIAQPLQDDKTELGVDTIKRRVKLNDEQEEAEEFLKSRGDAEEANAHAPVVCLHLFRTHTSSQLYSKEQKLPWWIVLADEKRCYSSPLKITNIPKTRLPGPHADADEALLNTITRFSSKVLPM